MLTCPVKIKYVPRKPLLNLGYVSNSTALMGIQILSQMFMFHKVRNINRIYIVKGVA